VRENPGNAGYAQDLQKTIDTLQEVDAI